MRFMLQLADNLFEMEIAGTFDEDGLISEVHVRNLWQQFGGVGETNGGFNIKAIPVLAKVVSYCD